MKPQRKYLIALSLLAALLLCPNVRAELIYIAQNAQGQDTGSDGSNAHSVTFFNDPTNWSSPRKLPGKIGPGDTVHLVGTISTSLVIQGAGMKGKPITILFDPGAKMSAPYWEGSAIKISRKDYIVIDGGATGLIGSLNGNPALANGVIECTDNGTMMGNQIRSAGVCAQGCNYLTVKNIVVSNMYVRARGGEQNSFGVGICNEDISGEGITNYIVYNCIIHDAYIGVSSDYGSNCDTYEFSYITAYNCNWGGRCGDRGRRSNMTDLSVHHNHFYNWTNWDDTERNSFHHNGFFAWAMSGGSLAKVRYFANFIGPNYSLVNSGEPSRANHATSGLFVQGEVKYILAYNNVFVENQGDAPANGSITISRLKAFGTVGIYNNTFIGGGHGQAISIGGGTGTYIVKNNVAIEKGTFIASNRAFTSILIADYNVGYRLRRGQEYSYSKNPRGNSSFRDFTAWRAMGYGTHSFNKNPNLNARCRPMANSPLIGAGEDLSNIFATDGAGSPRPKGRPWTIGAYEFMEHDEQ
jgi:hypothetical protein